MPDVPVLQAQSDAISDVTPQRQCGRCRMLFDGDPGAEPFALPQWWICDPCRGTLLPNRLREDTARAAGATRRRG